MGVQYSCNSWLLHTDNWGNAQNNDDREGRRAEADGGRAPFRPTQFSSPLLVYRVTMVVAHQGWVDLDLGCSTLLLGSR